MPPPSPVLTLGDGHAAAVAGLLSRYGLALRRVGDDLEESAVCYLEPGLAEDARRWRREHTLLDDDERPTWRRREE